MAEEVGGKVVIAIDEAQGFGVNWLRFDRLFAYIFDNLTNLRLVLSGSQVGLLYGFMTRVRHSSAGHTSRSRQGG